MKLLVFALLWAVASAAEFSVKDKDGKKCALLTVDGEFVLTASKDKKLIGKADQQFSEAKVMEDSTCKLIKLDLQKSAEMSFQFDEAAKNWKVTPVTTFVPKTVFGNDVNDTDPVNMKASPLEQFPQDGSYKCVASTGIDFVEDTQSLLFNYTAKATVTGFQIQSLVGDSFKKVGKECAADAKPEQYMCKNGNKTLIVMEGNFTLGITYVNQTTGKDVTVNIAVPGPKEAQTTGVCEEKAKVESLSIGFFDTWSIDFTFTDDKKGKYYSITNMTVTFTYDDHLPGHTENGTKTVVLPVSDDYLKASTKGYYICDSKLAKSQDGLTLTSKKFKYRAFDEKSAGLDGDVSECSGDMDSNSVVPIAVGAALAGLVVIVLVAYLIGRKRTRKTGYESV